MVRSNQHSLNAPFYIYLQCFRDAWKKLENMSQLEAMHSYVETLLKVATEVITAMNFCHKTLTRIIGL